MPYIKNDGRREILQAGGLAANAGELNYQIFYYTKNFLEDKWIDITDYETKIRLFVKQFLGDKPNYQKYNDMVGCLVCCKTEIKRRFGSDYNILLNIIDSYDNEIADYEDLKIQENGDVE